MALMFLGSQLLTTLPSGFLSSVQLCSTSQSLDLPLSVVKPSLGSLWPKLGRAVLSKDADSDSTPNNSIAMQREGKSYKCESCSVPRH